MMANIHHPPINSNSTEEKISLSYTVGVPTALLEDPNLTDRQFRLMIHLIGLARKEGYCWASDKYLSQKMNVSIKQIQRELQSLEKNEWIVRNTIKEGMKSVRSIYVTPAFSKNSYEYSRVSTSDTPSGAPRILPADVPISKASNTLSKKDSPNSKSSDVTPIFSKFSKDMETACETLLSHVFSLPVKSHDPRKVETTWFNWLDSMRKIMEIDHRSISEVTEMIDYIHTDDFWDINVRSPQKLREKWVEIELQKKKKLSNPKKEDRPKVHKAIAQKLLDKLNEKKQELSEEIKNTIKYSIHPQEVVIGMTSAPMNDKTIPYADPEFVPHLRGFLSRFNLQQYLT